MAWRVSIFYTQACSKLFILFLLLDVPHLTRLFVEKMRKCNNCLLSLNTSFMENVEGVCALPQIFHFQKVFHKHLITIHRYLLSL